MVTSITDRHTCAADHQYAGTHGDDAGSVLDATAIGHLLCVDQHTGTDEHNAANQRAGWKRRRRSNGNFDAGTDEHSGAYVSAAGADSTAARQPHSTDEPQKAHQLH
ncbi:MAG TPA: hypothetical protein VMR41_05520 [Patescibacteria group bacterium]|nr:hypothetical protein [Patescibacteria group bacterium]